jgi:flagellum-specific ATP synthase
MPGWSMTNNPPTLIESCRHLLDECREVLPRVSPWVVTGRLTRVSGLVMEAVGIKAPVGSVCVISLSDGHTVDAEVVGFSGDHLLLMPSTDVYGVQPGARVSLFEAEPPPPRPGQTLHLLRRRTEDRVKHVPVGPELLGRVVDHSGHPLDNLGPLTLQEQVPLHSRPINPLKRAPIKETLDVGIRAINALLPIGRGQRMGLFAGSGIGKSVLLGMMARYTTADVNVVGLIGERGREVKEFIENILGPEGMARSIVVASPADTPPLSRLQGAAYAAAIAEYFRDQGKNVLLMMDSLTRYAQAQREIALAVGEPPATRGYPPSVFAKLPQLVERAGNSVEGGGSITAFYTILVEGDDPAEPIADAARAILDGHIVLSRALADAGHYPAIDVEGSISRVAPVLLTEQELELTRRFKLRYSRFQRSRDLISVGAYVRGGDPELDEAIAIYPQLETFLRQQMNEQVTVADSREQLDGLVGDASLATR